MNKERFVMIQLQYKLTSQLMELEWESKLQSSRDMVESLHLCGIDIGDCLHRNCKTTDIICEKIAMSMTGKDCKFDNLVKDIMQNCLQTADNSCSTAKHIIDTLEKSSNAYISPDGRKFWPNPTAERTENKYSRFTQYQITENRREKKMQAKNSIVTMGSCFMNEINKLLISQNLLMRKTELNCFSPHIFPANWGTIYNPLSAQYALEWYFGERKRPEMLWSSKHSGQDCLYDVFREDVTFGSLDEFRKNQKQHIENSVELLKSCSAFVCAFSMTETWLSNDGSKYPLARSPWRINPLSATPYKLSYEEIRESIYAISRIFSEYNKECQIFVGVDPVPLHATHSYNNSILADSNAKATLVAAISSAVENCEYSNLNYVPFYESIHYCTSNPWSSDERHLNEYAINKAYQELLAFTCYA